MWRGGKSGSSGMNSRARSTITSGRQLFIDSNPNSAWSRRYADLLVRIRDMCGGVELRQRAQHSMPSSIQGIAADAGVGTTCPQLRCSWSDPGVGVLAHAEASGDFQKGLRLPI